LIFDILFSNNLVFLEKKDILSLDMMIQGIRKDLIFVLTGQVIAGVFLALFDVFAGNWLGVEKYGLLKILYDMVFFAGTIIIAGVMENLSRNIAYFKAHKDKKGVEETIQSSLVISFLTLILFIGLVLLFRNWVTKKFLNSENVMLLQFLLGIIFLSFFQFQNGIFLGYKKFRIFSFGLGAKEFLTLVFLFFIVKVWNRGVLGAGWSIALSPIFIILIFIIILSKIPNTNITGSFKKNINFSNTLRFVLAIKITSIMNQCILRSGPLILKIIVTDNPNYYAGIFSAITMPLKLTRTILVALCSGLLPNLTEAYSKGDENRIKRYIYKSLGIFALITAAITSLYFFFGPEIIKLIYGEKFLVDRNQTTLLAFAMSFFFLGILMANIMIARGTPKVSAISLLIGLFFLLIVIAAFKNSLPPINLLGTALLICNLIYFSLQSAYFLAVKIKRGTL
jgi:O-antigen/teichoic acid export membrane protein